MHFKSNLDTYEASDTVTLALNSFYKRNPKPYVLEYNNHKF